MPVHRVQPLRRSHPGTRSAGARTAGARSDSAYIVGARSTAARSHIARNAGAVHAADLDICRLRGRRVVDAIFSPRHFSAFFPSTGALSV